MTSTKRKTALLFLLAIALPFMMVVIGVNIPWDKYLLKAAQGTWLHQSKLLSIITVIFYMWPTWVTMYFLPYNGFKRFVIGLLLTLVLTPIVFAIGIVYSCSVNGSCL